MICVKRIVLYQSHNVTLTYSLRADNHRSHVFISISHSWRGRKRNRKHPEFGAAIAKSFTIEGYEIHLHAFYTRLHISSYIILNHIGRNKCSNQRTSRTSIVNYAWMATTWLIFDSLRPIRSTHNFFQWCSSDAIPYYRWIHIIQKFKIQIIIPNLYTWQLI